MNVDRQPVDLKLKNDTRILFCGEINHQIHMREIFSLQYLIIDGKKVDVYDAMEWSNMFFNGNITHDARGYKDNLLTELSMADEHIPQGVIEVVYLDGRSKGLYRNLDKYLSLCRNTDILYFLISHGAVFKTRWRKPSSMEHWFYGVKDNYDNFSKFIDIIEKYPKSIDMKWVKSHGSRVALWISECFEYGNENKSEDDFRRGNFLLSLVKTSGIKYKFAADTCGN